MVETLTEKSSTHKSEVVPVVLEKHPNADTLSVVKVWGYECVVRTSDWLNIEKAVYIVPDSVVDVTRPEFSFLAEQAKADGKARVKAKRLRGITSFGLLVPAPAGACLGEDWAERLGVERYEPPEAGRSAKDKFVIGGEEESGPDLDTGPAKYDVEAFERYALQMFVEGEPVYLAEKLDGSNARFVYWNDRFYVKTRNRWVKRVPDYSHVTMESLVAKGVPEDKAREIVEKLANRQPQINGFWKVLEADEVLMVFLRNNPGTTVYGEIFGNVNRLKYGFAEGNRFSVFDVYRDGRFFNIEEAINLGYDLPWGPSFTPATVVAEGKVSVEGKPYCFNLVKSLSEGKTITPGAKANVIREGVVVRPVTERWHPRLGRVILKCVNPDFLAM